MREHPGDEVAAEIYADAVTQAYDEAEPSERDRAALARYADRSGIDALRAAIDSFLERTDWGRERPQTGGSATSRAAAPPATDSGSAR